MIPITGQGVQQSPSTPQNQSHSRSSSFFTFRNRQTFTNQHNGHQRTFSMGSADGGSNAARDIPLQQTPAIHQSMPYQQQSQATAQALSPQSPLTGVSSTQKNAPTPQQSLGLHPEIRSIVNLTAAHAHKVYFSGPLVRRIERQPDGQHPTKGEGWTDVWAQLGGTTLSIWDMKQIREASKQGREVPPTYVNTTDAFVQVLGAVTTPATSEGPPKKYTNVLTLNTAGSNLLLFSCPSTEALKSWAAALRLSAWEKSRLEEIYTAHLIRLTLSVPNAPSTLVHGRMEGWVLIRIAGQTDWKRMWMVVTAGTDSGQSESPNLTGRSTPMSTIQKKKRMSGLFLRDSTIPQRASTSAKPLVSMYASPKSRDKKKPLLTMRDMTQAFAVYPERPELISRSTLIKVEGSIGDEEAAGALKSREGWLLIMPELEGGLDQAAEMLKWVVAFHDAFRLYGRPGAWMWDPRNPVSLMFAYPVGPNKDLLFLDRELAETLNPRDDHTSSIRSRLIGILLDRMRGHEPPRLVTSDKPPSLPPIGAISDEVSQRDGRQTSNFTAGLLPTKSAGTTLPQPPQEIQISSSMDNGQTDDLSKTQTLLGPSTQSSSSFERDKPKFQELPDSLLNRNFTSSPTSVAPSPLFTGVDQRPQSASTTTFSQGSNRTVDAPIVRQGSQVRMSTYGSISERIGDNTGKSRDPPNVQLPVSPISVTASPPADPPLRPRSPSMSVLTSPFSDAGHDDNSAAERASILSSPYSPLAITRNANAPWAPHPSVISDYKGPLSAAQPKPEELSNFYNEAGALYYMQQFEVDSSKGQSQPHRVPTTIAEQDDDDDDSSLHYVSPQPSSPRPENISPSSGSSLEKLSPVHQDTPVAFVEGSSSQAEATSIRSVAVDKFSPSRPGFGRKPSGARAQATRPYISDPSSSSQPVTEEESIDHPNTLNSMADSRAPVSAPSEDSNLDVLAALSYLDAEDKPSSPRPAEVEPLNIRPASHKASSPPPVAPSPLEPALQYKSSFAPSKQAAERKAKTQAQQAAHHAAVHKPGRANGKRKSKMAETWNESSEEEDEEEDEEDEDEDDENVGSDAEPALPNKRDLGKVSSNISLRQPQNQGQSPEQSDISHQLSHLRLPRTLPQIPGNQNYSDEANPSPRRTTSDQFLEAGRRTYYDGTQIRTQAEVPQPGAARQNMWSQVLDPGRPSNALLEQPRDTFVQLEPSETMSKAFTPQGLLSAGLQDKQDRSAKRQEELARETGASLINVPNKPPPPQMGLLGAITAHERERKREGGVGAALTEREREKRVAEDRQRRFDDHQRQQLDQMQQGGSMYGGQFPGYNMMGNPMMMMNPMMGMTPMMTGGGMAPMMTGGGMAPMMTGQMGFPGMMPGFNPQHMFAAQQAAQAYQQAMMAFSVAGSQMGDGTGGTPPLNPTMTGGNMGYDPRMSMMGMPMMGAPQMAPMGMQMTGMSTFDARYPSNTNELPRPAGFGGKAQGQPSSRNSSPAGRGSPLARPTDGRVSNSRPASPRP